MEKVPELAPTFSIQSFPISFSIQPSPISFSILSFPQIQPNSRKVPAKLVRFQVFGFFCACISSQTSFLGQCSPCCLAGKADVPPQRRLRSRRWSPRPSGRRAAVAGTRCAAQETCMGRGSPMLSNYLGSVSTPVSTSRF
jgi:hypothetical protein